MYTVDYFINKFEKIPEEEIGEGTILNKCAFWHCDNQPCYDGEVATALAYLFGNGLCVVRINDGSDRRYQQPTPKQRILAALYDIKKLNSELPVQECDATKVKKVEEVGNIKTKTVYVSVPETISKSVPETILS